MSSAAVDYSVYLVTDSTPALLGDRDLPSLVEDSLRGGVTLVQYRDKTASSQEVVAMAKKLHRVTSKYGVPLLINDRVDVAVAVGCEGVHIGQDDMEFQQAKALLGPGKIIGVTASSKQEALAACENGADYLGIGTVYSTATKKDTKSIIGPSGVREILSALHDAGYSSTPTVCIGGVNASNASTVLSLSSSPQKALDGIAVASAIIAADRPAAASRDLLGEVIKSKIPGVLAAAARKTPLSHNMTNLVVQNFAANVALSVGGSPIMSNYAAEAADLAKLGGALVLNMGTVTPDGIRNHVQALKAYNDAQRPVVFDPVGAGATSVRREAAQTLLSSGTFTIIKGNQSEIQTIHGAAVTQRGVDSSSSSLTIPQRANLVRCLARQRSCVVVMTGPTDLISDGRRTVRVDNGHELLGAVTGTGCALGTTLSVMAAAHDSDPFTAAVAGAVMFSVAAEVAAERRDVRGPGSFVPAFLDELHGIRTAAAEGNLAWLARAKMSAVEVEAVADDAELNSMSKAKGVKEN
ncbi:uncharacterized protein UV8b_02838 [Ustilaginoidea virens]|uniref:Thiamine phosphate synthase/TenI domain-containing protein n=1 Tax=Ustilaginoidea virens TaxID=1159556 RepID=A0A8E5HNJ8_USTVR|nr:uncharacterized protein UV8b_02838 [Ustilaginoidea virens]QUC18597.1 hypothetical protein UV8b_02838 [Ustilaginoidea virens]